jgi:TrmH family RNA methyltransferase
MKIRWLEKVLYLRLNLSICMISRNQIKFLVSLQQKKFRQKYHKFVAEGEKLVEEAINHSINQIEALYYCPAIFGDTAPIIPRGLTLEMVNKADMERISTLKTPPGIMALMQFPDSSNLNKHSRHIYLDGVADPGNVGTILRTADWFGVTSIICGPGTAEWSNPKVIQASMGSIFRVSIDEMDIHDVIAILPELPLVSASMHGIHYNQYAWNESGILIMGNESNGLSKEVEKLVSEQITIPKHPNSSAESLNVSVALAILLARWSNL